MDATEQVFDYIVVGAGSAGCVVAHRLAEAGHTRAGPGGGGRRPRDRRDHDPRGVPEPLQDPARLGLRDRRAEARAGPPDVLAAGQGPRRLLVDQRAALRARQPARLRHLARPARLRRAGATPTSCPYFLRAEDNARGASDYHARRRAAAGRGPALHATSCATRSSSRPWRTGSSATRTSTARPAGRRRAVPGDPEGRPALVGRRGLPASGDGPLRASPVETRRAGDPGGRRGRPGRRGASGAPTGRDHSARATAEVVLSGGAINSPQLLMLSGIGPAAAPAASSASGSSRTCRGVGGNLQDHLAAPAIWITQGTTSLHDHENLASLLRWQLRHDGPLASTIAEACAFVRSDPSTCPRPDLQYHVAAAAFAENGLAEPPGPGLHDGAGAGRRSRARGTFRLRVGRPELAPGHRRRLPVRRRGPRGAGHRDPDLAARSPARASLPKWLEREWLPGPSATSRRRPARRVRRHSADAVPPGRHLRDGGRRRLGGGHRLPGARGRGAARGRRLGDAGGPAREHQRARPSRSPRGPATTSSAGPRCRPATRPG